MSKLPILRVAFSGKLKCLPCAVSKHDVSAAWRFHWMIQQALQASNMYQVHTKHMQDTVINAHKMIEICQNSERNKGPQERPLGHTADDRDRF